MWSYDTILCSSFFTCVFGQGTDSGTDVDTSTSVNTKKSVLEEFFTPLEPPLRESSSDLTLSTDPLKVFHTGNKVEISTNRNVTCTKNY